MRIAVLLCLALAGCLPSALAPPEATDSGVACLEAEAAMTSWIVGHQGCQGDPECSLVPSTCCPAYANASDGGAEYLGLVAQLATACGPRTCHCPALFPPACNAGTCGPRTAACHAAADCTGALPQLCMVCSDGTNGCARWACSGGACQIVFCP